MTALHLGVSGRHVETVKVLTENADPSTLNAIDSVSIPCSQKIWWFGGAPLQPPNKNPPIIHTCM